MDGSLARAGGPFFILEFKHLVSDSDRLQPLVARPNAQAATAAMTARLAHRPLFLSAAVCALAAMLRPYPTLADMALYMVRTLPTVRQRGDSSLHA